MRAGRSSTSYAADRDRYVAALYAPDDKRPRCLRSMPSMPKSPPSGTVSAQPLTGEMRLQWWRDARQPGRAPAPASGCRARCLRRSTATACPRSAFDAYLEARVFDLYDDPMPSRTDLEGYCGETAAR